MRFGITAECHVIGGAPATSDQWTELLARFMDALLDRDVDDAAVSVTESENLVEIELSVVAETPVEALARAVEDVEAAIESVGASSVVDDDEDELLPPSVLRTWAGGALTLPNAARAFKWSVDPDEQALTGV